MKSIRSETDDLLTAQETAVISGASLKQVYKAQTRLPKQFIVRRAGRVFYRPAAALCVRIDHLLPKEAPVGMRKAFYATVYKDPAVKVLEHRREPLLSYVVDTQPVRRDVAAGLKAYREAMAHVVEDPDVQGGAATFRGTRILVHTVADLLGQGAPPDELKEDFPNLTDKMLQAAQVYAQTHPRRGRPRSPAWRGHPPESASRSRRVTA